MKIEIANERKNPAMKRDEYTLLVDHRGAATPTRFQLVKDVAKLLKTKEDLIIVDRIFSQRGVQATKVTVLAYKKAEDVPKYKIEKMKARTKVPKAAEKPAEAAPAESSEAKEEA